MSRVLESRALPVISSDLYERGYGESGRDFLIAPRAAENISARRAFLTRISHPPRLGTAVADQCLLAEALPSLHPASAPR
jgi:hypothetical protein